MSDCDGECCDCCHYGGHERIESLKTQLRAADELAKAAKEMLHDDLHQCAPSCETNFIPFEQALAAYDKARGRNP